MTTVELRLRLEPPRPQRRIGRLVLLPALVCVAAALVVIEARTFRAQAWLLSAFARELGAGVGAGPAPELRLPRPGPYDERLGYADLPETLERLRREGWRVAAQARLSPRHQSLVSLGLTPIYAEKTQAGLQVLDPTGRHLYRARYPGRVYDDFAAVPPVVARSLTFIENRELLDPLHPFRNPAVEWDRLATAILARGVRWAHPGWRSHGGSTLATQLEKSRHSPGGLTAGPLDKMRQMVTASLRAYRGGPVTAGARRRTLVEYLNALPLAAVAGHGEVHGLGDGLWAWYGADFDQVNRLLHRAEHAGDADAEAARAYRQVLALLLAQRRPAYYLVEDPAALDRLTDRYLALLRDAGLVPGGLLHGERVALRSAAPGAKRPPLVERKADLAVRTEVAGLLGVRRLYDLDRADLTVTTTLDAGAQAAVTEALLRLAARDGAREAGIAPLLGGADPAGVLYSFTLYERSAGANAVRVQVDSGDRALDLNDGAMLELGSTAKLRTMVHYLELVAELHEAHAGMPPAARERLLAAAPDRLTEWVLEQIAAAERRAGSGAPARDGGLGEILEAAMLRTYSASPWEGFFTGGGLHHFRNFDAADNGRVLTVREAFHRSVNLVFIRLMRDLVDHYRARVLGGSSELLEDPDHPLRRAYLERFAEREGAHFLRGFYRAHQGEPADAALAALVERTRPIAQRLAAIHRSTRPAASFEELERFLIAKLPAGAYDERLARRLYDDLAPERASLADRGYVARVHPLELWLVEYLSRRPQASLSEVLEASTGARQEVYGWLHRTRHLQAQNRRIRTLLEIDAFAEIHRVWQRLGYPFDSLVASYATAIGSSADRPAALAELLGIVANDGVRRPTERLTRLHFGAGTPFETVLERRPAAGERVLHREVAALVREEMLGVVRAGTATRSRRSIELADGSALEVGGKTGTGDNRLKRGGREAGRDGVLNRTATFVFLLGDRFYGTVVAYVPGQDAADYDFTSSTAVQVWNHLLPAIAPVLSRPVSLDEWSLFREPVMVPERLSAPRQIAAAPAPSAEPAAGAPALGPETGTRLWTRVRHLLPRRSCRRCEPEGRPRTASLAVLAGPASPIAPARRRPGGRFGVASRARARRGARRSRPGAPVHRSRDGAARAPPEPAEPTTGPYRPPSSPLPHGARAAELPRSRLPHPQFRVRWTAGPPARRSVRFGRRCAPERRARPSKRFNASAPTATSRRTCYTARPEASAAAPATPPRWCSGRSPAARSSARARRRRRWSRWR